MAAWEWFALARNELSLFAAVFVLLGAIDEMAVDCTYLWLRSSGRCLTPRIDEAKLSRGPLSHRCAIFIPAWQEARVIGATVSHALDVWPHQELWLFVGCYRNDPETAAAAAAARAQADPRLRVIVADVDGPSCKADCLNHLFTALRRREAETGEIAGFVVLHDAEDMVDPAALPLLDRAMEDCDFAQLPVVALPQRRSPWIAGHYSDEFAEAHGKNMVVRSALGIPIPGAGVGCAINRPLLNLLDEARGGRGPFAVGALTEDYELGLTIGREGGRARFLRHRTTTGRLIATRSYFPSDRKSAVRQKTRWTHGIALQGWDRLGWRGGPVDLWMQLRDRRGPFAALLLAIAYSLIVFTLVELLLSAGGVAPVVPISRELSLLLILNTLALLWRALMRACFTAREHGLLQGLLAVPRIVVSNTIAILAGVRALSAYVASLRGAPFVWDKTTHDEHPTSAPMPALRP